MEQETIQNNACEDVETVSINSVQFNINCSVLTVNLKTSAGQNSITVPYKIDTGCDGNLMPMHIFKKLFLGVTNEQLAATINKCILFKTYNKITITQLGMCKVVVEHKK